MDENKKLEFRGSSFMALVPFAIFIVITIALSFFNAADTNMMIGAGVIGLLVGMFFAKNLNDYWDIVLEGLGSKVAMTAVMLWLVVGIYGNILNRGQIVEGLVWLSVKIHVSGAAFTVAAFIFATANAIAPGSVTPNAGFISSLIICDNSCIVKPSLFTCFLFSVSITYSFPLLLQKHILRSLLRKRVPILSSIQQALQSK